jgi:hypothetical protein
MARTKTKKSEAPEKRSTERGGKMTRSRVERERYEEKLPCEIPMAAVQAKSKALAHVIREREEFLEKRKSVNSKFREQRAYFDEQIKELGQSVENNTEIRRVVCVEYLVVEGAKRWIEVIRSDTSAVINTREADADDLQDSLPGVPPAPSRGKKAKAQAAGDSSLEEGLFGSPVEASEGEHGGAAPEIDDGE